MKIDVQNNGCGGEQVKLVEFHFEGPGQTFWILLQNGVSIFFSLPSELKTLLFPSKVLLLHQ